MDLITVERVGKIFQRRKPAKLLREHVWGALRNYRENHTFYALRDISFSVGKAEGVQIVGANGAGKTTLLSVLTGLTKQDSGNLLVNGKVGALLDLGSGFHPDLTGRENLALNAALIGIKERRLETLTPQIIDFAELGDVIDEPLRTYSAGMVMRLSFAVAICLNPEILIIDELLGVGDSAFQRKCLNEIVRLRKSGMALLYTSHGSSPWGELCSRALWLHKGELVFDGEYSETFARYSRYMDSKAPEDLPTRLAAQSVDVGAA